jgi:hypothetical protein
MKGIAGIDMNRLKQYWLLLIPCALLAELACGVIIGLQYSRNIYIPQEIVIFTEITKIVEQPPELIIIRQPAEVITKIVETQGETIRLPEYHLRDPRTVEEFEKLLYDSTAVFPFDFGDKVIDCDNYARQAEHYAASQGILLSLNKVDQKEYDEIFGDNVAVLRTRHMIVMAIINNEIWYADYNFPIFNGDNTLLRPQEWKIAFDTPLD